MVVRSKMGIPGLRQYRPVSRTSRIRFDKEDAHVPIQRPFRHKVTAKGRTKCSYVQNSCAPKFPVGPEPMLGYAVFVYGRS